jgi:GDPmannose 4,6-dehydratase
MTKRKALITGITGQDGYYLAKLLLEKDYEVYGMIRRQSQTKTELGNAKELESFVNFEYGDLTDETSINQILHRVKPNEVYNLAAQSHVKVSFSIPVYTAEVNAMGPLKLLNSIQSIVPYARFYQASTSEMFGNQIDADGFQRETTPMIPVSPYGTAKLFAHNMVGQYRKNGMFACSGILFNHESPKRGDLFVTKKITNWVKGCENGFCTPSQKLQLGNLNARRDWGHAEDYVNAMWLMLQHSHPDDYVVATGETHSIQEFLTEVFFQKHITNWMEYVEQNPEFFRPEDVHHLKGDSTKIRKVLGWTPQHTLQSLIKDMLEN